MKRFRVEYNYALTPSHPFFSIVHPFRKDTDVAVIRESPVRVTLILWKELVDGGKGHAAGLHGEKLPQVCARFSLHRRLAQQVLAAREGAEMLVLGVIAE